MQKISELLTSGEAVDAIELALRALPGGSEAVDTAVADIIAARQVAEVTHDLPAL